MPRLDLTVVEKIEVRITAYDKSVRFVIRGKDGAVVTTEMTPQQADHMAQLLHTCAANAERGESMLD
jgi:hypothetical protein